MPEALACWSTAPAPAAVDSPLYSSAVIAAVSGRDELRGDRRVVPAPAVIGAVQTLCSVWSGPVKWLTSVNVSPAESVTLDVLALRTAPDADLDDEPIAGAERRRWGDRDAGRRAT